MGQGYTFFLHNVEDTAVHLQSHILNFGLNGLNLEIIN